MALRMWLSDRLLALPGHHSTVSWRNIFIDKYVDFATTAMPVVLPYNSGNVTMRVTPGMGLIWVSSNI